MSRPLMLFAAGFGTRMGLLTKTQPKPLIQVGGVALIDRALSLADAAHAAPVVANTHYLAEHIAEHLSGSNVRISHEADKILDTGGGLRAALPLLGDDPVFTLNPDVIWLGVNPLTSLQAAWDPDRMDALLMCIPLERTHGRKGVGDFALDEAGRISRGADFVYGGAQIIKTDQLGDIEEEVFSLNLLWDRLAQNGRLFAAVYPGEWCDVGHPENIAFAERMLDLKHV